MLWIHSRVMRQDRNYVSLSAEEEKKSLCTIVGAKSADDKIFCCVEMWRLQLADIGVCNICHVHFWCGISGAYKLNSFEHLQ